MYNVTFFDQMLRLLRSTCVYCFHFRMSKAEVDRYACKLRLIQYGLLEEAVDVDKLHMKTKVKAGKGGSREEEGPGDDVDESDDDDDDVDNFIARRRKWVQKAISRRGQRSMVNSASKITAIADARRQIVKDFMGDVPGVRKCTRCQA